MEIRGACMAVQAPKTGRRKFILLPRRGYDRVAAQARRQAEQDGKDAGDVAESRRRMKESGGWSLAEVRASLKN
jgi:hypothetical protein